MSIDVTRADDIEPETWNSYVERSATSGIFHQHEALETIADHTGADLVRLLGRKGQEPVGLLPAFVLSKGPFRAVFSPPPNLRVSYLGPAFLNMGKLKRRKAERRRRRFVDGCFDWLAEEVGHRYLHLRTTSRYADVRPFQWNGCSVTQSHTYVVDLTPGREDVLMAFSSDARGNVRNTDRERYEITVGDRAAVERVVSMVRERYESQGETYGVPPSFVTDLYDGLPEGQFLPYVCRVDGEFVGGMLAHSFGDRVYRWQGGVKTDRDVDVPVNDLLDWRVMTDAMDRGLAGYDLVGADNQRINRYKAKFGPELKRFYSVETGTRTMNAIANLYKRYK
jgi:hypothetical protein